MSICIMHFASGLLRIFVAKICFLEFLYGILLVLSRCCFHHLVENSILYKKDIQHFYIGPILFQKIKSYGRWSAEKMMVKFYLAPAVRNRQFYLAPGMRNRKMYWHQMTVTKILFGSQRVKTSCNFPVCSYSMQPLYQLGHSPLHMPAFAVHCQQF